MINLKYFTYLEPPKDRLQLRDRKLLCAKLYEPLATALKEAGIFVKWVKPSFENFHHKPIETCASCAHDRLKKGDPFTYLWVEQAIWSLNKAQGQPLDLNYRESMAPIFKQLILELK